ncbi:unnamed protein product, partial [Staurois parvus]
GSGYLSNLGTHSHFRCDRLGDRKRKLSSPLPPSSLLEYVTGPRRLQDHSECSVLLVHAQWAPCYEAASCHSRVPTLKMPAPGTKDGW